MKRIGLVLLVAAVAGCGGGDLPGSPELRARGLTINATPKDRAGIEAALSQARPEATSLIEDVDGMVTITTARVPNATWVGLTQQTGEHAYQVTFNLAFLNGERKQDRNVTVLHELGHVIDFAVTPPELRDQLA